MSRGASALFGLLFCAIFIFPASAQDLDTAFLVEVEKRVLPSTLVPGPASQPTLPDYYWAANPQLKARLDEVKAAYERSLKDPDFQYRAVTLISGSAGIGKTFIKGEVVSKSYPKDVTVKFDIKELYDEWEKQGFVHQRPDLTAGDITLSHLPSVDNRETLPIKDYLNGRQAAFYIIDSLDEIHPNDYTWILGQIERFALDGKQNFIHVVVLGRTFAFAEYWTAMKHDHRTPDQLKLFELEAPQFRTLGDLRVSSLNSDTFFHKLRWAPEGETIDFDLKDYTRFEAAGFAAKGEFASATFTPNESMTPEGRGLLLNWVQKKPFVVSTLGNLAGNGIIREICDSQIGQPDNDRKIKEAYLMARLLRESKASGRPGGVATEDLDLYLQMLEETAAKYLREKKVDKDGWFVVHEDDAIDFSVNDQSAHVRTSRILDRSGMKQLRYSTEGQRTYRFEPVWLHRLFVERYMDRQPAELVDRINAKK